ncbi:MAG: hypothetical protein GXP04_00380 [Alphaproteobacteria bacterium]|nr:hypothetical protein [Alphaproteobacteria bacterium]
MSILVKIGVAGVIGFAATTGASAQTIAVAMDQSDFLAISEAPLGMSELSEARGGFKFGGFDFNFAVKLSPIVMTSIDNPLPDGVFGANGAPATGKDGIFGEDGVFGPGGVFGQNGSPPSSKDEVFGAGNNPGNAQSAPAQVSTQISAQVSAPAQVIAETLTADVPAQQSLRSSIVYIPSVEPTKVAQAPDAAVQQTVGAGSHPKVEAPTPPSYKVSGADVAKQESYTAYKELAGGLNTILSNTRNNVQFRRIINIDIVVRNFDARVTRAIGDTVTSSITSTYGLLSRF